MGCAAVGARLCICACGRWKPAWLFAPLKKKAATCFGPDMSGSTGGLCRRSDLDEAAGRDRSRSPSGASCTRGAGCTVAEEKSCRVWVRVDPTHDAMWLRNYRAPAEEEPCGVWVKTSRQCSSSSPTEIITLKRRAQPAWPGLHGSQSQGLHAESSLTEPIRESRISP